MRDLLLHPQSREQLERFMADPSHALMLLAPEGSGKRHVAETIARNLLALQPTDNMQQQAPVIYIEADNKSISIEAIRALQQRLQLKTIGTRPIRRVVIIEAAQRMTTEAQNALLKMLEEPPADTVFILTVTTRDSVLPTIYSRTQHIDLKTPLSPDVVTHFNKQGQSKEAIAAAWRHSGTRLGLTQALLVNSDHPLLAAVEQIRQLLGSSLFERLGQVDEWAKQKEALPERLQTLARLCQTGLATAAEKNEVELIKRWQRYYQAVYDTQASLQYTPNPKLLLTNLFLRLS